MSSFLEASKGQLTIGGVICKPDGTIKSRLTLTSRVPERLRRLFQFLPCQLQHDNSVRNIIADAVCDLFDVGTLNAAGSFKLYTDGGITFLSQVLMANPAFLVAVSGVAVGSNLPWTDLSAVGSGTADEFVGFDRDENIVLRGDIALSGEEMNFLQLEIAVNDIVKLLSVSYTAPP